MQNVKVFGVRLVAYRLPLTAALLVLIACCLPLTAASSDKSALVPTDRLQDNLVGQPWLHVDGRHIKTADGNIFVPMGAAYIASDTVYGNPEEVLAWCKKLGMNAIRISMREEQAHEDFEAYLTKHVDPIINACKVYGIYAFLDAHNYFHEFNKGDGFLPTGKIWSKERVGMWADNWRKTAQRYKDEPWVLGYELLNEPYNIDPGQTRDFYLQALKAIREVDTKHIIILGTCQFTHIENAEETWSKLKFRPDEPYNQVVFAFHEYTKAHDPADFAPVLDKIFKKYNVPILCTEFGSDEVIQGVTLEERRQFEKDMFSTLKERQIGWLIWRLVGTYPDIRCDYENIWQPALADATATSVIMKGEIGLSASSKEVIADNKTTAVITATIKGLDGKALTDAEYPVRFVIKGNGIIEGENPAKVINGTAAVKIKFNKTGLANVLALADGLYGNRVDIFGQFDKPAKIVCKAEPTSDASVFKATALITDSYGNVIENGAIYRVNCGGTDYVDSKGLLWLADRTYTQGSWGYTVVTENNDTEENSGINNTENDTLFYSDRVLSDTRGYYFTLPNGMYNVELFFVESWYGVKSEKTKGARVFDVLIENEPKIKGLDIYDKAGPMTAYSEKVSVEVKDGVLDIFADVKVDRAEIRAISITPEIPAQQITFSIAGSGTLEGINPVEPVAGKAIIKVKSAVPGSTKISASMPGLAVGTVDISSGK